MFITKKQFYDLVPPKGWDEIYKEMITTHEKILLRYFSCVKFGGFERPALYMIDRETFTNDQGGLFRYVIPTLSPCFAKAIATAAPIPWDEPVTNTFLPIVISPLMVYVFISFFPNAELRYIKRGTIFPAWRSHGCGSIPAQFPQDRRYRSDASAR